jgi:hypothetical protein
VALEAAALEARIARHARAEAEAARRARNDEEAAERLRSAAASRAAAAEAVWRSFRASSASHPPRAT